MCIFRELRGFLPEYQQEKEGISSSPKACGSAHPSCPHQELERGRKCEIATRSHPLLYLHCAVRGQAQRLCPKPVPTHSFWDRAQEPEFSQVPWGFCWAGSERCALGPLPSSQNHSAKGRPAPPNALRQTSVSSAHVHGRKRWNDSHCQPQGPSHSHRESESQE